jgi:hypothetical protein
MDGAFHAHLAAHPMIRVDMRAQQDGMRVFASSSAFLAGAVLADRDLVRTGSMTVA